MINYALKLAEEGYRVCWAFSMERERQRQVAEWKAAGLVVIGNNVKLPYPLSDKSVELFVPRINGAGREHCNFLFLGGSVWADEVKDELMYMMGPVNGKDAHGWIHVKD
jgi:hypothetical protein